MIPTITAFDKSPDGGMGLARDTRVRWALEEVGQPYEVRLVSFKALKEAAHLSVQPFGQIPSFEQDGLVLFESGGIIHHIADTWPGLFPADPAARSRAVTWMFAAVSTIEPPILDREVTWFADAGKSWRDGRIAECDDRIRTRLRALSAQLGQADWLDGAFTAGDLIMVSVLQRLKPKGLLPEFPNIAAYVARAEARPAFQRAFAAQLEVNRR